MEHNQIGPYRGELVFNNETSAAHSNNEKVDLEIILFGPKSNEPQNKEKVEPKPRIQRAMKSIGSVGPSDNSALKEDESTAKVANNNVNNVNEERSNFSTESKSAKISKNTDDNLLERMEQLYREENNDNNDDLYIDYMDHF